jgi:plasmid stability protein
MGQIIVRNLDEEVIARLKAMAAGNRTSLEQTVRSILKEAVNERERIWARIDAVRVETGPVGGDTTELIREDRDRR